MLPKMAPKAELNSKVLIAGHNLNLNQLMEPTLNREGFEVSYVPDGDRLLQVLPEERPAVIGSEEEAYSLNRRVEIVYGE